MANYEGTPVSAMPAPQAEDSCDGRNDFMELDSVSQGTRGDLDGWISDGIGLGKFGVEDGPEEYFPEKY